MSTSQIPEIIIKAIAALGAVLCVSIILAAAMAIWLLHETHKEDETDK